MQLTACLNAKERLWYRESFETTDIPLSFLRDLFATFDASQLRWKRLGNIQLAFDNFSAM
jgi:hypothetical protein